MQAWWLDTDEPISTDTLRDNDVLYERLGVTEPEYRVAVDRLKLDRGYVEEDVIELRPETPSLEAICAKFVDEHRHTEDEVRFVLHGEGIFDIRSRDDRYMRVQVEQGDLIVVPKDRNHRFMLTDRKTIRCVRLFQDKAGWVPHYREART